MLIDAESDGQEMFDNEGVNEGGLRSNMHELKGLDKWFFKVLGGLVKFICLYFLKIYMSKKICKII